MLYEMRCNGPEQHEFEQVLPLSRYDDLHSCPVCGASAEIVIRSPRAHHSFETAGARVDETIYRQHNVTRESVVRTDGGTLTARPISVSDGCKCGNCASHARRSAVTAVAEPGKNR